MSGLSEGLRAAMRDGVRDGLRDSMGLMIDRVLAGFLEEAARRGTTIAQASGKQYRITVERLAEKGGAK